MVPKLLEKTGIDLKNGVGIPELNRFQEHFHEYKIVVHSGLNFESILYQEHVYSDKRVNFLFDEVTQHYHVIAKFTGTMDKRYVCEGSNEDFKHGVKHNCEQT